MGIQEDATTLLLKLAAYQQQPNDPNRGHYSFSPEELPPLTGLEPNRLNDAVQVLENQGFVNVLRFLGTHPFDFGQVELTARGRLEAEKIDAASLELAIAAHQREVGELPTEAVVQISRSPIPVGSPYGFTDEDWEFVTLDKSAADKLIVVFGYQWQSNYYASETMAENLRIMFEKATKEVQTRLGTTITLDFRPLHAGYGSHLFNKIARDIIGSDVAVFETSDRNANVMIEMGVALTWRTRVMPIYHRTAPKPPSDISGQTWVQYAEDGSQWDNEHDKKLQETLILALRKKGSRPSVQTAPHRANRTEKERRDDLRRLKSDFESFLNRFELQWELRRRSPTSGDELQDTAANASEELVSLCARIPGGQTDEIGGVLKNAAMTLRDLAADRGLPPGGNQRLLTGVEAVLRSLKQLTDTFDQRIATA